jgi:hypothetical protein
MIAFLEEVLARLFGTRQELPVRVRANRPHPQQRQLKGPK